MVVPLILGITGGTGAGKTTAAHRIFEAIGPQISLIISQDSYYRDRENPPLKERERLNFDHPSAFENGLLFQHLGELKAGNPVPKLYYDYKTHTRMESGELLRPRDLIVVEGILLLEDRSLRKVLDLKIWVETDPDLRLIRRIRRDMGERGRSLDSVIKQYLSTVRPMHCRFVEPSKRYADLIISGEGEAGAEWDRVIERVRSLLERRRGK